MAINQPFKIWHVAEQITRPKQLNASSNTGENSLCAISNSLITPAFDVH